MAMNREEPIWAKVGRFCEQWTQSESPLQQGIREIWLEFDVTGKAAALPQPSFFIGFQTRKTADEYQQLSETTVELLQDSLLTAAFRHHLSTCFTALPTGAHLFSIGVMLARPYEWARVCIGSLSPDDTLPYLEKIGWPGPLTELKGMFGEIRPLVDEVGLALDVGEDIRPKLGLECYLQQSNPQKEARWEQLLDCLIQWGQCSPEKKEALLRWPGRHFHGLTPTEATQLRHFPYPFYQNLLTRRISHLKIVLEPDRPLETKGYLELNNMWIPMGPVEG